MSGARLTIMFVRVSVTDGIIFKHVVLVGNARSEVNNDVDEGCGNGCHYYQSSCVGQL